MRLAVLLAFAGGLGAPPVFAQPPESPEEFVERFRAACARKDRDALLAMFHTEGASQKGLDFNKAIVKDLTEAKIAEIGILPVREDAEYTRGGIFYRPNLPALKTISVTFEKETESGHLGADLFLGAAKDAYVFTTTVADTKTAAERAASSKQGRSRAWADGISVSFADVCANEIGVLCERHRKDDRALLQCLREHRSGLMRPCRTAIKALR